MKIGKLRDPETVQLARQARDRNYQLGREVQIILRSVNAVCGGSQQRRRSGRRQPHEKSPAGGGRAAKKRMALRAASLRSQLRKSGGGIHGKPARAPADAEKKTLRNSYQEVPYQHREPSQTRIEKPMHQRFGNVLQAPPCPTHPRGDQKRPVYHQKESG